MNITQFNQNLTKENKLRINNNQAGIKEYHKSYPTSQTLRITIKIQEFTSKNK